MLFWHRRLSVVCWSAGQENGNGWQPCHLDFRNVMLDFCNKLADFAKNTSGRSYKIPHDLSDYFSGNGSSMLVQYLDHQQQVG